MTLYLVNWDDFQKMALEGDEMELTREAQARGLIDETEFWNWELFDAVEEVKHSANDPRVPFDFLEEFDRFSRAWKSDGRLHFKEVFDTLLWEYRGDYHRVMGLKEGESIDLYGIDTALDPETTADLLRSADRITLEECRPLFKDCTGRFATFDDWMAYGEEWLAFVRRAAKEQKGLIVAMFS